MERRDLTADPRPRVLRLGASRSARYAHLKLGCHSQVSNEAKHADENLVDAGEDVRKRAVDEAGERRDGGRKRRDVVEVLLDCWEAPRSVSSS